MMYSSIFPQCDHTVCLTDTYGDGWNGEWITVSVNGIVKPALTNLAMATNSAGPEDFIFSASISNIIAITKTAAGSWTTKMRVELFGGT